MWFRLGLVVTFVLLVMVYGYYLTKPNPTPTGEHVLGIQSKTSDCQYQNKNPDPQCTPGSVFPDATPDKICVSGYTQTVRDVSIEIKRQVYQEYGITTHTTGQYEVDHLISLELGGNNDLANLWPEPANPIPGFHEKDKVENYLHNQVCDGKMSLQQAQKLISSDWISVYNYMSKN